MFFEKFITLCIYEIFRQEKYFQAKKFTVNYGFMKKNEVTLLIIQIFFKKNKQIFFLFELYTFMLRISIHFDLHILN